MSRYSKEEWERRKTYLIRSLFEDLPILSPINESQEPSSPSNSYMYRPESPLPDLIIEKEPPKHQDSEDEEFYEKLAREMRKRYKKDFLNMETSSSAGTSTEIADENTQADSFDIEGEYLDAEQSVQNENVEEEQEEYNTDTEEEVQETKSSSSSTESSDSEEICRYEKITTTADVHADIDSRFNESLFKNIHTTEEDEISQSESIEAEDLCFSSKEKERCRNSDEHEVETRPAGSQELTPTEASQECDDSENSNENNLTPEIIRRHQTILSEDSLPLHELPIRESNDIVISKGLSMEMDETIMSDNITHFELNIADVTHPDSSIHYATSTPKSLKSRSSIVNRQNRLVPYTPSSRGSKDITSTVALQTSFSSEREPEWKDIWSNFFLGTPTVYNVCSCKDHVCT